MHWLRAGVSQSIMPSPFPSCTDFSSSDKVTVGRHNPSDRTTLAQEAVVLHLDGSGGGNSLDSAYPGGSSFSGVDLLPPGGAVEPHSVATEEELLKGKGFSDLLVAIFLSCRKRETQAIYPKVWKRFNSWCTESSFNVRCSVAVLEFLHSGADNGLALGTLKGQMSVLSVFLEKPLAIEPWIARFFRALGRQRPVRISPFPVWDLSLVLQALAGDSFEPLESCTLKLVPLKTVFGGNHHGKESE